MALHKAERTCLLVHRGNEGGLAAAHSLGQGHGRIVARLRDHAEDRVPHGNPVPGGEPEPGAALRGRVGGDIEHLVEPERAVRDRGEGHVKGQQLGQ